MSMNYAWYPVSSVFPGVKYFTIKVSQYFMLWMTFTVCGMLKIAFLVIFDIQLQLQLPVTHVWILFSIVLATGSLLWKIPLEKAFPGKEKFHKSTSQGEGEV